GGGSPRSWRGSPPRMTPDRTSGDFGAKLREARERRGITLRQIAVATKISASALDALERNDISKLPGGIFSRAFVRSYASEVGLNPEETVREFLDRFQDEPAAPAAVPAPALSEDETKFESRLRRVSLLLRVVVVTLVAGAAVTFVAIRWRAAVSAQVEPPPAPPAAPASIPGPAASVGQAPAAPATADQPARPVQEAMT